MGLFSRKKKEDDFLDLTKEPLPNLSLDTNTSLSNSTLAKLDLINTRLQNIEAKLERIEYILTKQPEKQQPSSPIKW